MKKLLLLVLIGLTVSCGDLFAQRIDLNSKVNGNAIGEKFDHFWSKCVGAGRAHEGLRASWLEQMQMVKDQCGFQYCRFHGLLHDDMFVYKEVDGRPVYNWQYIDDLFDRMLKIGVRPFVEFGFMPTALARGETTQFWWKGNITPPKDYDKWGNLINECVQHWISRYGIEEVRKWYFEIWNEPNLIAFWTGTKSEYFKMYNSSIEAIKSIDKGLRVGGPATSNFVPDDRFATEKEDKLRQLTHKSKNLDDLQWQGVWIKDFLDYCQKENLSVDFVSTHPYPTDWALDSATGAGKRGIRQVDATLHDLTWLKDAVSKSAYPNAEIHLTEWNSSPSPRDDNHDRIQSATFILKTNLDCIGLTNSLSYWVFTDVFEEGGAGSSIFHGGFGMINYQGIVKPSFHAYRMLNELGDTMLHKEEGLVITRNSHTRKLAAILYHYPMEEPKSLDANADEVERKGTPRNFHFTINSLNNNSTFISETLDKKSGYAYPIWKEMGSPETPNIRQTEILKEAAMNLRKEILKVNNGTLEFNHSLEPWTCILIKEM